MLGAYGYFVGQAKVYPRCVIVEGSDTRRKYIVTLYFLLEVINCAIFMVVLVALVLISVFVLYFRIAATPPPPPL